MKYSRSEHFELAKQTKGISAIFVYARQSLANKLTFIISCGISYRSNKSNSRQNRSSEKVANESVRSTNTLKASYAYTKFTSYSRLLPAH